MRTAEMLDLYKNGYSLQKIAEQYQLSTQRIQQLLYKYHKEYLQYKTRPVDFELHAKKELVKNKRDYLRQQGIVTDLSVEGVEWLKVCPFTKIKLDYLAARTSAQAPILALIDTEVGWINGNVSVKSKKWKKRRKKKELLL